MNKSRRLPILFATVVMLGATSTAGWWAWHHRDDDDPATPPPALATAEVTRQDMSTSVSMSGRLGYGTGRTVNGGRPGIVTWLPAAGAVRKRGQALYRIDDVPVPVFYGRTPLFRTLDEVNTVGRDVRVVADNLQALGYTVGRRYQPGERVRRTETPAVAPSGGPAPAPRITSVRVRTGEDVLTTTLLQAITKWRDDAGLPASGSLGIGDVAVLREAVRVESTTAQVGDQAEGPLLTVTSTGKVVTVDADPTAAAGLKKGVQVEVRLPDDRTLPGKVSQVSTTVAESPEGTPELTVTIALDNATAAARLDTAPVEAVFPGKLREDVLAVPVGALVALAEGGYAVQVAGGGLVAVTTGIFAGGLVEVSGDGVAEGTRVVTTS